MTVKKPKKKATKKKIPKKQFSIRQKKYRANRLIGMSQYNAARAAGYSENYARQACRVEKTVKNSIHDIMEQEGITPQKFARVLHKQMVATTMKTTKDDAWEITDNAAVSKALDLIGKLYGWTTVQKHEFKGEMNHSGSINFFKDLVKRAGVKDGEN